MRRSMVRGFVLVMAALLLATPLFAYTIFLKDGSRIVAKEVHRIEGDRVIITLPNGTETFISLEEVDLERTREFNEVNLDGAVLLEGGETKALPIDAPEKSDTLRDLIASGEAKPRSRAPVRRQAVAAPTGPAHTTAGYLDLGSLERRAYGDTGVISDLRSYFSSQGLEAQVFRGSQTAHPLIEVTTNSEAAVFKTIEVAAQALPQLIDRHATRVTALELLLLTEAGSAAGQFVLTPELAETLNSGETEVAAFFIREVQF